MLEPVGISLRQGGRRNAAGEARNRRMQRAIEGLNIRSPARHAKMPRHLGRVRARLVHRLGVLEKIEADSHLSRHARNGTFL